ncbi:Mss4-like protein [Irpex rosettiformis]|uniref:Mss4-like protein n=1 Tax=Irpex rosettiformis TaxID=378272 RepID=A0ACB8UER0_9APHY|nr:Mss4-like protein [Irpex rosettiformis]
MSTKPVNTEAYHTGSCLCGQISYEITGNPKFCVLCHCVNCKKWTGSGSGWLAFFNKHQVRYTKGEDALKTYADGATDRGSILLRNSCAECSAALTVVPTYHADSVGVMVGSVDGDVSEVWKPKSEVYCKDRPKWLPDLEVKQYDISSYASSA